MKRICYLFSIIIGIALFFGVTVAHAQVTVTSSDTIDCSNPCTVLTSHLTGDAPINAGITTDDIYSPVIPIGFTFNFYGTNYTNVVIGANGTLDFTASDALAYDPWPISAALLGNPSKYNNICGAWCDIDMFYTGATVGSETYSTDGVAPNRKFVVTWCGCSMYNCGSQKTTQQIIIYETSNIIEVHMAQKLICSSWNGGYAIIGVQNATGSAATTAPGRNYPSTWSIPPTEAWRFTPSGGGTAYTVASIPYAPVPYSSSLIYWYDVTAGTYLGTGGTMTVCPTSSSLYRAAALGCSDTSSGYYFVTSSGSTAFTITSTNPTTCGGCNGTITLGGLTPGLVDSVQYAIGGGAPVVYTVTTTAAGTITISGLCAGLYDSIKVKAGSCWSLSSTATLVNPAISMTAASTNPTYCGACNGTITLSGLYASTSYIINYDFGGTPQPPVTMTSGAGGTITLSGLCAGAFTNITAAISSSAAACVTPPVTATLTNPPISMTGTSANNSYCGVCDGTITLNGLFATTVYSITYSLAGVPQPPITLTSDAAGSITITGLCAGTYTNIIATIVSSAGACVTPAIGPFTITAPPPPPLSISAFVNPSQCGYCDGSITIKAITPFTTDTVLYSFNGVPATAITTISHSDSTITLSGLCAGAYTGFSVKVGDCLYTVTGSATLANPTLTAKFDTSIHFGCHGDTVTFTNESFTTPSGGLLYYIWHFGDGSSDTSTSPSHIYPQGTYTVTLLVNNHVCEDSMLMTIPLVHPLIASFIDSPSIICQDELITFTNNSTVSGGYPGQFLWSFGTGATDTNKNTTYTFLHTGTYTVQLTATDWVPCHDTFTAVVQVDTISGIQIRLSDTVICQGTYVTYTGLYASLGNTGDIWDFGDGSKIMNENPVVHGYNDAGTFTITVTAEYRACQDISTTRTVVVIPQPYINLGPDTSICKGSESFILADNLNGNNPAASWVWGTGQTGPSIVVVAPGYYYATVNINNCYASDTVWVQNGCYMDIPNVFSPNGDGVNDFFFPRQFLTKGLTTFSMNIYNRWGELIFTTTALDGRGWDGKFNNVEQPEGVYVYVIDATFKDGQKEHHQGNVTLLR